MDPRNIYTKLFIWHAIQLLKNMDKRIIDNKMAINELALILESYVGVDPENLIDFDLRSLIH